MELSPCPPPRPPPGSVTPPRSGLSSPLQEPLLPYTPAPPSYEQALQHHYPSYMDHPPPPYFSVLKSDPSLYPSHPSHPSPHSIHLDPPHASHTSHPPPDLRPSVFCPPHPQPQPDTPDPDSLLSDCGPDTPDSSIKEEASEEASEGTGVLACRWRSCGREFTEKRYLVDHVTSCHIEQRKGCDDFPCYWEGCPRRLKPFNAKYKLLTHMRVHTGEKPYICRTDNCMRSFARLENLKIHNRSHTGEKPFLCKFSCNKAFSNSSDRAKHEQTHKDPKPYKCDVPGCQKRYTDPSSLRKHVKNHSREEQEQGARVREAEAAQAAEYGWEEAAHLSTEASRQERPGEHLASPSLGLMAGGGVVGYHGYTPYTPPPYRRPEEVHYSEIKYRRGEMHHQPSSLDSVEGEALPFDTIPIRFDGPSHDGYDWT